MRAWTFQFKMRIAAFDVGVVNMVYAVIDAENAHYKILHWEKFSIGNKSSTCFRATDALVRILHRDFARFSDVDVVVVEQQMVTRMTVLSHVLQSWFLSAQLRGDLPSRVVLQSPGKKGKLGSWLARNGHEAIQAEETAHKSYAANKRNAVADARKALEVQDDQRWRDFFEKHPKKDDLADALLHALWFAYGQ